MTAAERLEQRLRALLEELTLLASQAEFEEEDPFRFVRDAAAIWERTLKSCTLSSPPTNPTLNNLIHQLEYDGVSADIRNALHAVRSAANKGKHDPIRLISTREARELLVATLPAPAALEQAGVPEMSAPAQFGQRRRYVIAVYDHFVSGETEFSIWLEGHPPREATAIIGPSAVEIFSIRHNAEDEVKRKLSDSGDAQFKNAVAPDIATALHSDSEFFQAWSWEGSHRELVRCFAPHQWNLEVTAGLARADHVPSALSAAAMALVDTSRPADWPDLLWKMSAEFGIWRRGTQAEPVARLAADLLGGQVDRPLWGPRWASGQNALELIGAATYSELDGCVLGITVEDVVVVGLDVRPRGISIEVMKDDALRRPDDPLEHRDAAPGD